MLMRVLCWCSTDGIRFPPSQSQRLLGHYSVYWVVMIIQCINEGTAKEINSCCSDPSAARSVLRYIVRLENGNG